jgi:flagellar protein FliL
MATEKESTKEAAPAAAAAGSGHGGWLPVIVVLVLVPAISFALAEFVLFPRLEKRLAAAGAGGGDPAAHGAAGGSHGKPASGSHDPEKKAEPTFAHEFKDIVSNLAGSMRSRYIKVSFTAYSANPELEKIVEENRAKLLDSTLTILSALSLADTEDPTIKPRVKGQLVQAYEAVLHERVIEEIYFSEFVIQ